MPLHVDLAERVISAQAAVRRDPDLQPPDKVQKQQDIIAKALLEYGRTVACSRGAIDTGYRDDRELMDWVAGDPVARNSAAHTEFLLDPESGWRAALRRARAAKSEAAA